MKKRATERRLKDVAKKIKHKNYRQLRGNRNAKKDNPRVVQKSIRYTPDEVSYLEQASKMYQKTIAEYIRWRSLNTQKIVDANEKLVKELKDAKD